MSAREKSQAVPATSRAPSSRAPVTWSWRSVAAIQGSPTPSPWGAFWTPRIAPTRSPSA